MADGHAVVHHQGGEQGAVDEDDGAAGALGGGFGVFGGGGLGATIAGVLWVSGDGTLQKQR